MVGAMSGWRETVNTLLKLGADPNLLDASGEPPLFYALQTGDEVCITLLSDVTNTGNILIIVTFT